MATTGFQETEAVDPRCDLANDDLVMMGKESDILLDAGKEYRFRIALSTGTGPESTGMTEDECSKDSGLELRIHSGS